MRRAGRYTVRRNRLMVPILLAAILSTRWLLPAQAVEPDYAPKPLAGRPIKYAHLRQSPGAAKGYAIEFRARYALSYGHAFVMFGPLNATGDFAKRTVAGLHPAGDDPTPWMIGHVLPVPSETGPSDGDMEDKYMSARYRVELTRAEYDRVVDYIHMRQASNPRWHVVFNNCIQFISDIGRYMGLVIPSSGGAYPKEFINQLRQLNEGNNRSTAQSRAEIR